MKDGLIGISPRTKMIHYRDDVEDIHYLVQCSEYYAAETIKRGQPVSIQSYRRLTPEQKKANTTVVVPTDILVHSKCIGIALNYAAPGEIVRLQTHGTFTYDKSRAGEREYVPNFNFEDSGKTVYAAGDLDEEANNALIGTLTTDYSQSIDGFRNIIQLGWISDYPNGKNTTDTISLEVQLNGDARGPIDHTQFFFRLGEDTRISSKKQARAYAIGCEEALPFHFHFAYNAKAVTDEFIPFLAVQKLDGDTAILYKGEKPTLEGLKNGSTEDYSFLKQCLEYAEEFEKEVTYTKVDDFTRDEIIGWINTYLKDHPHSFNYIDADGKEVTSTVDKAKYTSSNSVNNWALDVKAAEVGGYYSLYVSKDLLKGAFFGTYTVCAGSVYNKGKAVVADIRIPNRRNVLGLYWGHKYDRDLKAGELALFIREGVFESSVSEFEPGAKYYLGYNGVITNDPGIMWDRHILIASAETESKLMTDAGNENLVDHKDLPVGYIQPSFGNVASRNYLLMDGETKHSITRYNDLFKKLQNWFSLEMLTNGCEEGYFIIPAYKFPGLVEGSSVFAEIKWLSDGLYSELPREAFLRKFGTITKNNHQSIIEPLDITPLAIGDAARSDITIQDIEAYDIHLFVMPYQISDSDYAKGKGEWIEIPSGFYKYNNDDTYGYEWHLIKDKNNNFNLTMNVGKGFGLAYFGEGSTTPLRLAGFRYKVWIGKKEYFRRALDLESLLINLSTATLDNNDDRIATVKAVKEYIQRGITLDSIETETFKTDDKETVATNAILYSPKIVNNSYKEGDLFVTVDNGEAEKYEATEFLEKYLDPKAIKGSLMYSSYFKKDNARPTTLVPFEWLNAHETTTIDTLGSVHGIKNGAEGNINAAQLQGLNAKDASGAVVVRDNDTRKDDFIPVVHNKVLELLSGISFKDIGAGITVKNNEDGTYTYEFGDNAKISCKVISFQEEDQRSSIQYKHLLAEDMRSYKNGDEALDTGLLKNEEEAGKLNTSLESVGYGAALQALYELPMALYHYDNDAADLKDYVGLVVERLNSITQDTVVPADRTIFDATETALTKDSKNLNVFNYTTEELESIKAYIKLLTNDIEDGLNVKRMIGVLLKGAKETQERLLKIEESTFGVDAKTIPGGREGITGLSDDVTSSPTFLGLNRLIRALSREIFLDANPADIVASDDYKSSVSRIDVLDAEINGEAAKGDNGKVERIALVSTKGNTYPATVRSPAEKDPKDANDTDNYLEEGVNNADFDGLNNAVNRIVAKLNALTEAVYGRDNISANPVRLDTLRENVAKLIKDVYWEDYSDDVLEDGTNDTYKELKGNRIDAITKELYAYALPEKDNEVYTVTSRERNSSTLKLNGDKDASVVPTQTKDTADAVNFNEDTKEEYSTGTSIIDVILDTLDVSKVFRRIYATTLTDGNKKVTDADGDYTTAEFKGYTDAANADCTIVADARHRVTQTILNRIFTIEVALDKVVTQLSATQGFENTPSTVTGTKDISSFLSMLSTWSGVSFDNATSKYVYKTQTLSKGDDPTIASGAVTTVEYTNLAPIGYISTYIEKAVQNIANLWTFAARSKNALGDYYNEAATVADNAVTASGINVHSDLIQVLKTLYGEFDAVKGDTKYTHFKSDGSVALTEHDTQSGVYGNKNIIQETLQTVYAPVVTVADGNSKYFDIDNIGKAGKSVTILNEGDMLNSLNRTAASEHGHKSGATADNYKAGADQKNLATRFDVLEEAVMMIRKYIGLDRLTTNKYSGDLSFDYIGQPSVQYVQGAFNAKGEKVFEPKLTYTPSAKVTTFNGTNFVRTVDESEQVVYQHSVLGYLADLSTAIVDTQSNFVTITNALIADVQTVAKELATIEKADFDAVFVGSADNDDKSPDYDRSEYKFVRAKEQSTGRSYEVKDYQIKPDTKNTVTVNKGTTTAESKEVVLTEASAISMVENYDQTMRRSIVENIFKSTIMAHNFGTGAKHYKCLGMVEVESNCVGLFAEAEMEFRKDESGKCIIWDTLKDVEGTYITTAVESWQESNDILNTGYKSARAKITEDGVSYTMLIDTTINIPFDDIKSSLSVEF